MSFNTPVLFIVFNRADTTRQVFEAIRQAKPKQLFVAADGPRPDKEGEKEKCEEVRQIATAVDWDCEVKTLFSNENRGCGKGVFSAITWFFEYVEQGIILEDDCLPHPSFFSFCENILNYYKDNEKVMHISGNNFQFGNKIGNASYYFSRYTHIWGWATWKRAWHNYQFEINDLDEHLGKIVHNYQLSKEESEFWWSAFNSISEKKVDTWDYQWLFSVWKQGGVSVLPNKNLIKNIGFGSNATHSIQEDSIVANMPIDKLEAINHAEKIEIDFNADETSFKKIYLLKQDKNIFRRIKRKVKIMFNKN